MNNYSTKFWDRIAKRYAKHPIADEATYQKKLAITQQYFSSKMDVLEFGCGTGSTAIVHAPYVHNYRAIDVSPKMIEIAQNKLTNKNIKNLTFSVAALEEFQVEEESLDAVLGLSILHLMNDPDETIRRVYSLLKPAGLFVTSTICLGDGMRYFRFIVPIGKLIGLMPHIQIFSQQELENKLEQAGFKINYKLPPKKSGAAHFLIALKPD